MVDNLGTRMCAPQKEFVLESTGTVEEAKFVVPQMDMPMLVVVVVAVVVAVVAVAKD